MTRYLLDTNIWIYVMRNRPPQVRERFSRLKPASVVLSPIVMGELNVGWRKSERAEANRALLEQYVQTAQMEPIGEDVASAYGEIRAGLEILGTPIGENDMWIAAHARECNCILVTHNVEEFRRVPGLRIEDWVDA